MDVAGDLLLLILVAADDVGIDGAANGLRFENAVIGTTDVAGDALTNAVRTTKLCFAGPIRIGDEAVADGDEVGLTFGDDLVGNLRITDVAGCDDRFVEFLLDASAK